MPECAKLNARSVGKVWFNAELFMARAYVLPHSQAAPMKAGLKSVKQAQNF